MNITENAASGATNVADAAKDAARQMADDTVDMFNTRKRQFKEGADRATESMRHVADDVQSYVKTHPGQALIGALAIGFLAGRLFSRD